MVAFAGAAAAVEVAVGVPAAALAAAPVAAPAVPPAAPPEQAAEASETTDKAVAEGTHSKAEEAGTPVPAAGSTALDTPALAPEVGGMGVQGAAHKAQGIRTAGRGRGRGRRRMGAHTSGVGVGTTPSAASRDTRSLVEGGRACTVAA